MSSGLHHHAVDRETGETWRQAIVRRAEPFDRVRPCLDAYEALVAEFVDPDEGARADAAWDALLLGGCLAQAVGAAPGEP